MPGAWKKPHVPPCEANEPTGPGGGPTVGPPSEFVSAAALRACWRDSSCSSDARCARSVLSRALVRRARPHERHLASDEPDPQHRDLVALAEHRRRDLALALLVDCQAARLPGDRALRVRRTRVVTCALWRPIILSWSTISSRSAKPCASSTTRDDVRRGRLVGRAQLLGEHLLVVREREPQPHEPRALGAQPGLQRVEDRLLRVDAALQAILLGLQVGDRRAQMGDLARVVGRRGGGRGLLGARARDAALEAAVGGGRREAATPPAARRARRRRATPAR